MININKLLKAKRPPSVPIKLVILFSVVLAVIYFTFIAGVVGLFCLVFSYHFSIILVLKVIASLILIDCVILYFKSMIK